MKTKPMLFLVTLLLLTMVACNNEEEIQDPAVTFEKGKLTFVMPELSPQTYATAATGDEKGANTDLVAIYCFSNDNRQAIQRWVVDRSTATVDASGLKYTIDVSSLGAMEGHFVFIEAPAGATFPEITELNANPAVGALEQLQAKYTPQLTASSPVLVAPFYMSNKITNGKNYVVVSDVSNLSGAINVTMKRRVARFDIVQEAGSDPTTVTNVIVENASDQALLLDNTATPSAPNPAHSLTYTIPSSQLASPSANAKTFYLYPTVLGANKTELALKIEDQVGNLYTYNLDLPQDVNIESNNLYVIKYKFQQGSIKFELETLPWDDQGNVPTIRQFHIKSVANGTKTGQTYYVANLEAEVTYDGVFPANLGTGISVASAGPGKVRITCLAPENIEILTSDGYRYINLRTNSGAMFAGWSLFRANANGINDVIKSDAFYINGHHEMFKVGRNRTVSQLWASETPCPPGYSFPTLGTGVKVAAHVANGHPIKKINTAGTVSDIGDIWIQGAEGYGRNYKFDAKNDGTDASWRAKGPDLQTIAPGLTWTLGYSYRVLVDCMSGTVGEARQLVCVKN